jgi:hypothetical protein
LTDTIGWVASGWGLISAPLDDQRKLDGSVPPGRVVVVGPVVVVGLVVVVGPVVVVGEVVVVDPPPLQVVPLSANPLGGGLLVLFHEALKPNDVLAPVASVPL